MPVNALLVRWTSGWVERTTQSSIVSHGRREALLTIGAVQSLVEAQRVADRQLEQFSDPRTEITVDLEPMSEADTPYLAFRVGDLITVPDMDGTPTAERVRALTVAEDENGNITYVPELKDRILEQREAQQQALKKMSNGTIRGQSVVASPLSWQQYGTLGGHPAPQGG